MTPNHALHLMAAGRRGCNRENGTTVTLSACALSASSPSSLSLGR